jgi:signal transduction histidine kinase
MTLLVVRRVTGKRVNAPENSIQKTGIEGRALKLLTSELRQHGGIMPAKGFFTAKKLQLLEWLSYPLVLVPFITEYLESGHLPLQPREWITELVVGGLILVFVGYVRATRLEMLELDEEKADLTDAVIHDLKNPLSSVIGALEVLGLSRLDEKERENMFSVARQGCASQLRLIEMILEISRLEEGLKPAPDCFPPHTLVEEALHTMSGAAAAKNIRLAAMECKVGAPVCADRSLLRRVLENLVSNSIKYTPEGGVIKVSCDIAEHDGSSMAIFEVADDGSGLPPDVAAKLFHKYYRAEGSDQRYHRGSGIGLYFCRLAVEAHGGVISAGAAPMQKGAVVRFSIPQPKK